jgi:SAM-dependent methyltransferase
MTKKDAKITGGSSWFNPTDPWRNLVSPIALRFNREYRGETLPVSQEVESLGVFREFVAGTLQSKITSPFWEIVKPKKGQRCLDIGCGVSFLIYPWREWEAIFYGVEISEVAQTLLNTRGPQLNSKLFKGVKLLPAHQLDDESNFFDLVISTGVSCYFPLDYWRLVLGEVKRVLKPDSFFVFDVVNPDIPLAEDWAIFETYRGAEVFLHPLADWENLIKEMGGKITKRQTGELLQLYKVKFA